MPKLDLTRLGQLKMAGGEVAAIKGAGFVWLRPLTVTRAQLDTAIDGGTFAIVDSGITYTLTDSDFNVDVSNVTNMGDMFWYSNFNGDINYWNVSSVTNMNSMFFFASAFNQSIDNWNVSSVTNMGGMFVFASAFNQSLDNWNVSSVTNMQSMFAFASAFNQSLDNWNVSSVTNMGGMLSHTALTPEKYSRTLIGWANRAYNGGLNDGVQPNVTLGATTLNYNNTTYADAWPNQVGQQFTDAVSARAYLVNTMGWTITDGGQA